MIRTDEQLIELCRRGRPGAFKELLGRYQNRLMAFIFSMVRDYHLAEDIFQETFIRIYHQAGSFKTGYKFKTWLYTIAANRCRDELRKLKRHASLSLNGSGDSGGEDSRVRLSEVLPDRGPGPREISQAREFEKMLRDELGGLSPQHREVVIMSRLLGLKYDEIAEVLEIPSGTVRSRLHYALEYLRGRLKGKLSG